jgi:alkylated DNA repair dioxygenase AlkB
MDWLLSQFGVAVDYRFKSEIGLLIPEGFIYIPDFITSDEEDHLLQNLLKLDWQEVKMHGIVAKRRVVHFGLDYTYTSRQVKPTIPPPSYLHIYMKRAASLLQIPWTELAEILISEYPTGAGIGWHKDAEIFGDKVFGFSIGYECILKFKFKHGAKQQLSKIILAPRSAYILSGPARQNWEHSIAPVKRMRYSITFRTLRK